MEPPRPTLRPTLTRTLASAMLLATVAVTAAACGDEEGATTTLSERAEAGRRLAVDNGCAACHGTDGEGGVGPGWIGLAGSDVTLDDGSTITADADYLRRSISDPSAEVVDGFTIQMPENSLTDDERAAIVTYIEELA